MTGLILEGGGNRAVYNAGVLDVFAENDIYFPVTYAVSAGACNAMSYLSKQPKRAYRVYTEYASDKRYSSLKMFRKTGSLFGFDFIFGELADELLPFDYEEFFRTSMKLNICTTDIDNGVPVFFSNKDLRDDLRPLIASASLPVVANIVEYNGMHLLDGGVTSPIPIEKAMNDGITKNIIVLTRDETYKKKNKPEFPLFYLKHKYKNYPKLIDALKNRGSLYNKERLLCYEEQSKGNAIIIQPSKPINIKRSCKDPDVLDEIYRLGVNDANAKLVEINRFLSLNG